MTLRRPDRAVLNAAVVPALLSGWLAWLVRSGSGRASEVERDGVPPVALGIANLLLIRGWHLFGRMRRG